MATLGELIANLHARLDHLYGPGESDWLIRTIFEHLKGWNQVDIILKKGDEISEFTEGRVAEIVNDLEVFKPIQYIFGETYWHGLRLKVTPDVLIPRPETSQLVDIIVKENPQSDLRVMDLCTGSGCIAVALAKELRFAKVNAIDISPAALKIAAENATLNKVKINFSESDVLTLHPQPESFDIIVSNPPYVLESEKAEMASNVLDYEPPSALFVHDSDSIRFYTAIAKYSLSALRDGGKLYFELNPLTAKEVSDSMVAMGWKDIEIVRDMYGKNRFMRAIK